MKDRDQIEIMADELAQKSRRGPMQYVFSPVSLMQVSGMLQLACRHPLVSPANRQTAERFLEGVRAYFFDCPMVLDAIKRGDDPEQDVEQ